MTDLNIYTLAYKKIVVTSDLPPVHLTGVRYSVGRTIDEAVKRFHKNINDEHPSHRSNCIFEVTETTPIEVKGFKIVVTPLEELVKT